MEVLAQEVGALGPAVAVVDGEEAAVGPGVDVSFGFGLHDVEDYGDAVLVVAAHEALVGVGRVGLDEPVLLAGVPGVLDLTYGRYLGDVEQQFGQVLFAVEGAQQGLVVLELGH